MRRTFALGEISPPLRPLLRHQLRRIRRWDLSASRRVDAYIAISELSRERIKRYYGRDAADRPSACRDPPLPAGHARRRAAGRLRAGPPQARARRARGRAPRARTPIRVVGSGPDLRALRAAYPEAEFLGRPGDGELVELYAAARAVVVPSMEEFGITAVEAQAAGRPVIAAAAGGALETVLDGRTGTLVSSTTSMPSAGDPGDRRARLRPRSCTRERRALLRGRLSASSCRAGEQSRDRGQHTVRARARRSSCASPHPRRAAASIVVQARSQR